MLTQLRKQMMQQAKLLKDRKGVDYETESVDVLADAYCKAKDEADESGKNMFIAALVLRFWYVIKKLQDKSPGLGSDITECFSWLYEAIEYACKYRKWQQPESKVNAQQCINQCIETIRLQHYYQANLKKRKGSLSTISLDAPHDGDGDDAQMALIDLVADESETSSAKKIEGAVGARNIVQRYIDRDRLIDAIILDNIAFNDNDREVRKVRERIDEETGEKRRAASYANEFWEFKCVRNLSELPAGYIDYFLKNYDVKSDALAAAFKAIKKAPNSKLYAYLRSCLTNCRATLAKEVG